MCELCTNGCSAPTGSTTARPQLYRHIHRSLHTNVAAEFALVDGFNLEIGEGGKQCSSHGVVRFDSR